MKVLRDAEASPASSRRVGNDHPGRVVLDHTLDEVQLGHHRPIQHEGINVGLSHAPRGFVQHGSYCRRSASP